LLTWDVSGGGGPSASVRRGRRGCSGRVRRFGRTSLVHCQPVQS